MIASDSVEDVVLEECHARAITFNCPNMRHLSLKLSNIVSFTLLDCSSLRSLDLQCECTCHCATACCLGADKGFLPWYSSTWGGVQVVP